MWRICWHVHMRVNVLMVLPVAVICMFIRARICIFLIGEHMGKEGRGRKFLYTFF